MANALIRTCQGLGLLIGLVAVPCISLAHRLDEYLQATLVSIEPAELRLQINLTPGVAVAKQVLALIDRDGDGVISTNEARAYSEWLKRDFTVRLDRRRVAFKVASLNFPEPTELRTGWGIIQIEFSATLGSLAAGTHRLTLTNRHLPTLSVYLLNAAQPRSGSVQITGQKRNQNQSTGEIEFTTGQLALADEVVTDAAPAITVISPPESGFFAKRLDYEGIPIKAPTNVVDQALFAARERLSMMLSNLPSVRARLHAVGAELHIIGRDQVTTDLPEWRKDKGKPLAEYHGLTRDERTRGMGGRLTSCGEENLLKLEKDRYRGRDICVHEFAHNILAYGVPRTFRERVRQQYRRSLGRGLWVGSYAGSNYDEFFAELTMWYFGTHGDLHMKGPKPAVGREGLKAYDPEASALLDDFYSGRMEPPAVKPLQVEK